MIRLCAFADESGTALCDQIAEMKKHGISLLELRSIGGRNVADFTDKEAQNYAKELRDAGIRVFSIGSPLGKVDLEQAPEHMEKVRRVCRIAQIFGAKRVRIFSFYHAYENREAVFSALREMCAIAKEAGVRFYHENEKEIYGDTLSRVLEIVHTDIPGLGFVYDPANFMQCGESAPAALSALFDKIDDFHIKDVMVKTGELVPAGFGDGDIPGLLTRIRESGRDATLTLEPHLKRFEGYGDIDHSELRGKFTYPSRQESFAAAVNALKNELRRAGYEETEEKGEKIWQAK